MFSQTLRRVVFVGLFAIPLIPFLVFSDFFFPFITTKAFTWRIIIEIVFAAWVLLVLLDASYRPKRSLILYSLFIFLGIIGLADLLGVAPLKSFWSNFERMEGFITLLHLGMFFIVISSVFKEVDWKRWWNVSLLASFLMVLYSVLQIIGLKTINQGGVRVDGTLGNAIYLAVYVLFHIFIAFLFMWREWKNVALRWVYGLLILAQAFILYHTATRGAILGLLGGLLAVAVLNVRNKESAFVRKGSIATLVGLITLVGGFVAIKDAEFIQNSPVLSRFSSLTTEELKTQGRYFVWPIALEGVKERPFLGWGQENFNYIFNEHYRPEMYRLEPWFDRAHNAFIDWLSAGGIPAFLLYLSLFGSAFLLLWKSSQLSRSERIALTAALVGYAVHNLFVFDNLYSYIYFFAILALIDSQVARPIERLERAPLLSAEDGITFALPVAAVAAFVLIWFVNISGMQAATKLITAMSPFTEGIKGNIKAFEDLAAHPAFAAQEIREQTVSFAANVMQSKSATDTEKRQIASFAIIEMQKQVEAYPLDAREHVQLSYAYRTIGDSKNALQEIRTAITLSPNKEEFWIQAGALEWELGDMKSAQKDFNTAYALGGKLFPVLAVYAAAGNIGAGDTPAANKLLTDAYGSTNIDSDVLANAWYRVKDWPQLIALWKSRVARPEASVETWFGLASVYYASGDSASAIATIRTAVAKYPEAAASGDAAIKQIIEGR